MSEFHDIYLPSLYSKNILCTASLNLHNSDYAFYDVRRKTGDRLVDKISFSSAQLKTIREFLYPNRSEFSMNDEDISFIADIEFKNIRIAKYVSIDVEESTNDK